MSLTSIMKEGFSKVVVTYIPIPKSRFKFSNDCIACPKTKNYSLVGTAFDYLLRSELKRLHPNAKEDRFVAENSILIVERNVRLKGYFEIKNGKIGPKELGIMKDIAEDYKDKRASFLNNGILSDDFIEATLKFARLDVITEEIKKTSDTIMLDSTFGEASLKVGGADVDIIIGHTMIDIKTTKEMKIDSIPLNT